MGSKKDKKLTPDEYRAAIEQMRKDEDEKFEKWKKTRSISLTQLISDRKNNI